MNTSFNTINCNIHAHLCIFCTFNILTTRKPHQICSDLNKVTMLWNYMKRIIATNVLQSLVWIIGFRHKQIATISWKCECKQCHCRSMSRYSNGTWCARSDHMTLIESAVSRTPFWTQYTQDSNHRESGGEAGEHRTGPISPLAVWTLSAALTGQISAPCLNAVNGMSHWSQILWRFVQGSCSKCHMMPSHWLTRFGNYKTWHLSLLQSFSTEKQTLVLCLKCCFNKKKTIR